MAADLVAVKANLVSLLQTEEGRRGVALDRLFPLYLDRFHQALDHRALGFSFLREMLQSMPHQFILKYQMREETWKVYPNSKKGIFSLPYFRRNVPTTKYISERSRQNSDNESRDDASVIVETASTCSTEEGQHLDVDKLSLVPDTRGLYSICFPSDRTPEEWTDLREVFNTAGQVVAIHTTAKMTFVRYGSADAAQLALKMFPFLGLNVARANIQTATAAPNWTDFTANGNVGFPPVPQMREDLAVTSHGSNRSLHFPPELQDTRQIVNRQPQDDTNEEDSEMTFRRQENVCVTLSHSCSQNMSRQVFVSENKPRAKARSEREIIRAKRASSSSSKREVMLQQRKFHSKEDHYSALKEEVKRLKVRVDIVNVDDSFQEIESAYTPAGCFEQSTELGERESGEQGDSEGERQVESVPQMTPLEMWVRRTGVEVPCIFVTNFRRNTTEKELSEWFARYRPISVSLVEYGKKGLVKAHIELEDQDMVVLAIQEMNQKKIQGLRIKVDVPFFLPILRALVMGTDTGTDGTGTDGTGTSGTGTCAISQSTPVKKSSCFEGDLTPLRKLATGRSKVCALMTSGRQWMDLRGEVEVEVTHVINDSLFMGRPCCADIPERLREISEKISATAESLPAHCRDKHPDLCGPCLVRWKRDSQWHRAWIFDGQSRLWSVQVYFLDVGVLDRVTWSYVRFCPTDTLWALHPTALPFCLTAPIVHLKERQHSRISVRIAGTGEDGIISAVPLSLVSNWRDMMNVNAVLCE